MCSLSGANMAAAVQTDKNPTICEQIWEKGQLRTKRQNLAISKLSPFQSSEGLWLYSWFVGHIMPSASQIPRLKL